MIAGTMTGNRKAYDYLADSIETFPSGEAMIALMKEGGFKQIDAEPLHGGISTIYTAVK